MPDSDSLVSGWLERRLTADETARLSTHLARDPELADELAEMAALVQALDASKPHAPPVVVRSRRFRTAALAAAAAAVAAAGTVGLWWRPALPPAISEPPPPPVSVVGSRSEPGGLPRPPRSAEERAQASLDRFLRRHAIAGRSWTETSLREIAEECLGRLRRKHDFDGTMDFSAAGARAERPLTFSKPAGSLHGLLQNAAALAGCRLVVNPHSVSFVPIPASPAKRLNKRLAAAPEAPESVRNFCVTGSLPPTWGLPASEFHAIPRPDGSLEVTATEWGLAQLEQVIDAMDAPLLTVDVMVCALPPAETLESLGMQNFVALDPAEAAAPSTPPSPEKRVPDSLVVGSVLTEAQWDQLRPGLLAAPESVLAEFSVPVLSGQWTDLGDHAPDLLRGDTQSLGLAAVLGVDESILDLKIGNRFPGAGPAIKARSSTSITVWAGFNLLLRYTDATAPAESRNRGLVIRVHPLE